MMKLIVGVRGTGKTKQLVDMVNQTATESKGSVICIEYGNKLNFDVTHKARLIDAVKYKINDAHKLLGFIAGISASDHDITHLFVDSALKICDYRSEDLAQILPTIEELAEMGNFECVLTISIDPDNIPESMKKYI